MIQIPCVKVGLLVEDVNAAAEAVIRDDGRVGALLPGTATILVENDSQDERCVILDVDGNNNVEPLAALAGQTGVFHKKITLEKSAAGQTVIKGDNAVLVLQSELRRPVLYRVSLISRGGMFYLITEERARPAAYHDDLNNEAVCPFWEQNFTSRYSWLTILPHMRKLMASQLDFLPPLSEYTGKEPRLDLSGFTDNRGRVKFWRESHGWGGVVFPKKGLVRVNWSQLQGQPEGVRPYLTPGAVVECSGFRSLEVRGYGQQFRFEAMGVKRLKLTAEDAFTAISMVD